MGIAIICFIGMLLTAVKLDDSKEEHDEIFYDDNFYK
jgi:hypothetical protein